MRVIARATGIYFSGAAVVPAVGVVPAAADVAVAVAVSVEVAVAVVVAVVVVAAGRAGGLIPDGPETTCTG